MRKYFRTVTPEVISAQSGLALHLATEEINLHTSVGFRSPVPWLFPLSSIAAYFVATEYFGFKHVWVRGGGGAGLMLGLIVFGATGMFFSARSIAYERILAAARERQRRINGQP